MSRNIMIEIGAFQNLPRKEKRGTEYKRILKRFYTVVKEFDLFLVDHELNHGKIRIISNYSEINEVIQTAFKRMPEIEIKKLAKRRIW